jgi:hypothetical protein
MNDTKKIKTELVLQFWPDNRSYKEYWSNDCSNSTRLHFSLVDAGSDRYSGFDDADQTARNVVLNIWQWRDIKQFSVKPVAHDVYSADFKQLERLTKLVKGLDYRVERASVVKDYETRSPNGPAGYKDVHEAVLDALKACSVKRVFLRHKGSLGEPEIVSVKEFYDLYLKKLLDELQEISGVPEAQVVE